MTTGKTNSRHMRLLLDGVNLSGDARQVGSVGITYDEDDVAGWSDGVRNFTLGHPRAFIEGFQSVFNNTAVTGSHIELSAVEQYIGGLFIGIRAAPAIGDPAFGSPLQQGSYVVQGDGPVTIDAALNGPGQGETLGLSSVFRVWGAALAVGTSIAVSTNHTSVDNGASSANGALAYMFVSATTAGNFAFKVQDSPDNALWADLITFTMDGSAVAAEQGSVSGTVDRYTRLVATRTGGTVSPWCILVRL